MSAYKILQDLVRVPAENRREMIAGLFPDIQSQEFTAWGGKRGVNLILGSSVPRIVLGAHYDIDPATVEGAMDNASSVATLIDLAQSYDRLPDGLQICFWDLEEPGNGGFADGSEAYGKELARHGVTPGLILVCDVLGVGEPWLCSGRTDPFQSFLVSRVLGKNRIQERAMDTPGSDNVGLARAGVASALMCTLPANGDQSVWSAMHTERDRIELIDPVFLEQGGRILKLVIGEYLDNPKVIEELRANWARAPRGGIRR